MMEKLGSHTMMLGIEMPKFKPEEYLKLEFRARLQQLEIKCLKEQVDILFRGLKDV